MMVTDEIITQSVRKRKGVSQIVHDTVGRRYRILECGNKDENRLLKLNIGIA